MIGFWIRYLYWKACVYGNLSEWVFFSERVELLRSLNVLYSKGFDSFFLINWDVWMNGWMNGWMNELGMDHRMA